MLADAHWNHNFRDVISYLDTLALGQRDPGLLLSNDEDVGLTGGEGVVNSVLDVDDVETSIVALTVSYDTNTTHVTTTGDHADNTSVEAYKVGDLASGNVNLHGVVDLDGRVGVADARFISVSTNCTKCSTSQLIPVRKDLGISKPSRPPPINQSLVQRLNDAELVESISLTFSHRA